MHSIKLLTLTIGLLISGSFTGWAQNADEPVKKEKITVDVGGDIVSQYICRAQQAGAAALQPHVALGYRGWELYTWGTIGLTQRDCKEIDIVLSYQYKGLKIGLADFFWVNDDETEPSFFEFRKGHTGHILETQLTYDFGPVSFDCFTVVAGKTGVRPNGKPSYATYLALNAPFKLGGVDWIGTVGATPWANTYYDRANGFAVIVTSIRATKQIPISEKFSLPVFVEMICNPSNGKMYMTLGVSI